MWTCYKLIKQKRRNMNKFIKYPSIKNFRETVKGVMYQNGRLEGVKHKFLRTPKIHGTNASVVFNFKNGNIYAQSRNRVLTVENDNAGFAKWVDEHKNTLRNIQRKHIALSLDHHEDLPDYFVMYGEWCGPGIMKGTAINQLSEKIFVVFDSVQVYDYELEDEDFRLSTCGIDTDDDLTTYTRPDIGMYPVTFFDAKEVEIDFSDPSSVQDLLLEEVKAMDEQCPVAGYFNKKGSGEGYVYHSMHTSRLSFKVKTDNHRVSKTKFVSKDELREMKDVEAFVGDICTNARLEQGIEYLREMGKPISATSTGTFIKWVVEDTFEEEGDVIEKSGLKPALVKSVLANVAREYINTNSLDVRVLSEELTNENGLF